MPVLDGAMIDLKGWREPVHLALTGRGRERAGIAATAGAGGQVGGGAAVAGAGAERFSRCHRRAGGSVDDLLLSLGPVPIRLNGFRHHGVRGRRCHGQKPGRLT